MKTFVQITPELIIDIEAIISAGYFPPEDGHGTPVLQITFSNGIVDKCYGETAAKLWALIQERTAPMEAF